MRGAGLRALVIVAHPRDGSFNHALARAAEAALDREGFETWLCDLYAEGFDPVLPEDELLGDTSTAPPSTDDTVRAHQERLRTAHTLVLVHPNWWGKPPGILAGWMDRVLAPGVVYRLGSHDGEPEPLLSLQRLVVLNTSETTASRERSVFGDPLQLMWERCVGEYVPSASFARATYGPMSTSGDVQRQEWLAEAADLAVAAVR